MVAALDLIVGVLRGIAKPREHRPWLTVTGAARLLLNDLDNIELLQARARISAAANRNAFSTNGKKGKARRIEPVSFDAWRLKQRDRDLDNEDAEHR